MSTPASDISIIICTRNRAPALRETLISVSKADIPAGLKAELLVVDNGSFDDTKAVVEQAPIRAMPVRYIYEPALGLSRARNRALAEAKGDVFLFTDDDVRVPVDWIEGMCRPVLAGEADAVAGGVRLAPHLERKWMTPWHRSWYACTERLDPSEPDDMVGANMAFHSRIRARVPVFDSALGAGGVGFGEETLFSWQLKAAGYRLAGALNVCVEHHMDPSRLLRRSLMKTAESFGRSTAYLNYHWRHLDSPRAAQYLPRAVARLWLERLRRPTDVLRREGAAEWELGRVQEIAFYRAFIKERMRPRRYARMGLEQLADVA
ncbi:MAG: glycosyltransferase family 2 protein [Armatimonadetes bacterium]|nr:glycosyltransferase family 2 protein [Armatimonadota bacterium]